jgi:hypothetical protein
MVRELKILVSPDNTRRVVIFERGDGLFGYEEERQVQVYHDELAERLNDYSTAWVSVGNVAIVFDTLDAAERDAKLSFPWIGDKNLRQESKS